MKLIRIGYWRNETYPDLPDPHDWVDLEWSIEERELAVVYLDAGLRFQEFFGLSPCRFCGKHNGFRELTDGTYVWPEGLSHYVREHGVRLPQVILDHINKQAREFSDAVVDDDWWVQQMRRR